MANPVLVLVEIKNGVIKKNGFEVASLAAQLAKQWSCSAEAAVFGVIEKSALETLGQYGITTIHHFADPLFDDPDVHTYTPLLAKLIKEQPKQLVLASASAFGKELLPRLAATLQVGMCSDCTQIGVVDGQLVVRRPVYAGKAYLDLRFNGKLPLICSLRPNVHALSKVPVSARVVPMDVAAKPAARWQMVERRAGENKRVDLAEADIIVSGGRSLKSAENFSLLFSLADVIGASVGASRAAVDAGYAPHSMQVGQTGKVVSPKLYLAFGISGAIQHLAGMRTSKVIVAINTDPEAPIFKRADYGIVGDLFQMAPAITAAFKQLLGKS